MPNLTASTCFSDADCNGEGKCVQVDGTFNCDCTIGYIEPHCRNRDPCMLEGNVACQNGSTCKRKSNFEYECMCRVPYEGEFCDTYDLCNVDVDECFDDLHRDDPLDPICPPCVLGATCTQISKRNYICSCAKGYNHSSCYNNAGMKTRFLADTADQPHTDTWNPIIPTIALTSCCLYFLLVLIVLILLGKRKTHRPKLIVCCDIREFDSLSYYLISVETGIQWNAGTKSNVYCFLCGENGDAGPYPLFDRNLSQVHALQRCQEDNYLISHPKDLGRVYKIVIWYDDKPDTSSWFCDKITIRNIKTEENWFFYTSTWFKSNNRKRRHEFLVASIEYVRHRSNVGVGITCQHYCYQMARHHTYISPFIYSTPERITLMFGEWMSYMLILISLYAFLMIADEDINYAGIGIYVFRTIVPENGSLAAFACFWIGLTCSLLLMFFLRMKRIPTLIIWHNKPGMPVSRHRKKMLQPPKRPSAPPAPKSKDESTNTLDLYSTTGSDDAGLGRSDSSLLFRIPSTDVVKTEKWVDESADHTNESNEVIDEPLVHAYNPSNPQSAPDAVLDYGLIGGLTDGRQQEPNRFVYVTNSNETNIVCAGIEKDIHDIYEQFNHSSRHPQTPFGSQVASNKLLENKNVPPPPPKIFIEEMQLGDNETIGTQKSNMGAGDFLSDEEMSKTQVKVYCELCEMDIDRLWNALVRNFTIIGWLVCLILIVSATIICCIYGGRYGYQRTNDWIISLTFCWLENFFIYQFLKILFIVLITSLLIKRKTIPSYEAVKLSERFQVHHANGLAVLPEKYDLKFVQYLPKNWIPTPHVKLHCSNVNSDTSITKEQDKNV